MPSLYFVRMVTTFYVPGQGSHWLYPLPRIWILSSDIMISWYTIFAFNILKQPEKGWEIDIDVLRSQIDDRTKAILINNPSNPCGSCFSRAHQMEILKVAEDYKIPIISDEVYYGLVYGDDSEFISMGNLSKDVPVIVRSSKFLNNYSVSEQSQRSTAYQVGDSDGTLFITIMVTLTKSQKTYTSMQ